MKQTFELVMNIVQYENVATPLATRDINSTHQHFQRGYITSFSSRDLKVIGQSRNVKSPY